MHMRWAFAWAPQVPPMNGPLRHLRALRAFIPPSPFPNAPKDEQASWGIGIVGQQDLKGRRLPIFCPADIQ